MRVRHAVVFLAPFGVLLAGALFVLFGARSAGAAEVASPLSDASRVLNNETSTAPSAPAPAATSDAIPPVIPVAVSVVPTPPAVEHAVDAVGASAAHVEPTSVSEPPSPGGTPGSLVDALGGGVPSVPNTTPLDPVLGEVAPLVPVVGEVAPLDPVVGEVAPLDGITVPPPGRAPDVGRILAQPGATATFVAPPLASTIDSAVRGIALSSLRQHDASEDGRVDRLSLGASSRRPTDARAEPADAPPATSDPPIWYQLVGSLSGATSAQATQRAGAGLVLAILVIAVGLVATRRRFIFCAALVRPYEFASLITRPG
jgi:hypothetical protein